MWRNKKEEEVDVNNSDIMKFKRRKIEQEENGTQKELT